MKKTNIVKNNRDFNTIIEHRRYEKNKNFIIYFMDNEIGFSRYGISVGKKIGNAVTRNKLKRQVRNIIDKNKKLYHISRDYIIIVRKDILVCDFKTKENTLVSLLNTISKKEQKDAKKK